MRWPLALSSNWLTHRSICAIMDRSSVQVCLNHAQVQRYSGHTHRCPKAPVYHSASPRTGGSAQKERIRINKRTLPPVGSLSVWSHYGRNGAKDSVGHLCTLNTRLSTLLPSIGLPGQATNQFIPHAYGKLPPFPEQKGLALISFLPIPVHLRKPGIHSFHSLM